MFIEQIKSVFMHKGENVIDVNIKAFNLGYEYFKEHYPLNNQFEIDKTSEPRALTSGNDAIAKGALDCGLKFYAGYPITPATKIMEITAKELPKLGGWTSRWMMKLQLSVLYWEPGLSLMSEMINLSVC